MTARPPPKPRTDGTNLAHVFLASTKHPREIND
jgi:hypothetical protein